MLHERVLIGSVVLEVCFSNEHEFKLKYGELVEYSRDRRRVRGRSLAYEFRSVEQMRYDFERDIRELHARAGGGRVG